jgi:type IV pilus assembly protein PilOP
MSRGASIRVLVGRLVLGPVWLRYGVLLVWGAALSLVIWWLLLQDLQQALPPDGPSREAEATKQAKRLAAVQQEGEQRMAAARAQQAQLSALEAALPAVSELQSALAAVHQASRKHGLRMELFKPGPVGSEKPYPQQRAILRLSGSFDDVLGFTRTLAVTGAPVALESFSLMGSPLHVQSTSSNLTLDAILLSLHQPAASVPVVAPAPLTASAAFTASIIPAASAASTASTAPAITQLNASGGDPFERGRLSALPSLASSTGSDTRGIPATPAQVLQTSALASMRLMGSVQSAGKMTALVMAGGMLHAVRLGDALGNARGLVTEIRASDITVREPGGAGAAQPPRVVVLSLSKD